MECFHSQKLIKFRQEKIKNFVFPLKINGVSAILKELLFEKKLKKTYDAGKNILLNRLYDLNNLIDKS